MRRKLFGLTVAVACAWRLGSASHAAAAKTVKNLSDLNCVAGQVPEFDGTNWVCADLQPPRFVDNGDGTITDNRTGLMWEKKTSCGAWWPVIDYLVI